MILNIKRYKNKAANIIFAALRILGGRGEIRTHGGREPTTVFKTVALNRSATLPITLTARMPDFSLPDSKA